MRNLNFFHNKSSKLTSRFHLEVNIEKLKLHYKLTQTKIRVVVKEGKVWTLYLYFSPSLLWKYFIK